LVTNHITESLLFKQPKYYIKTDQLGFKWIIRRDSFFLGIFHDKFGPEIDDEIQTYQLLRTLGSSEKTFVDIGAHVGRYAVRLSKHYHHIIAIEPDPFNFEGLRRNLGLNNVKNVRALNLAASNKKGNSALYSAGAGSRLDVVRLHKRIYNVQTDSLDNLVDHADVVKIDVEGHEVEVLEGASRVIAQKPIFVIEDHTKTYGLTYWHEVLKLLSEFRAQLVERSPYHEIVLFKPKNML